MKKLLYISFLIMFFLSCQNSKKTDFSDENIITDILVQETDEIKNIESTFKEPKPIENTRTKTIFELIKNKKETVQNLPKDFDVSKNYTEKELKALNLDPAKIDANEYYFLSEQDFLEEEVEGLSFQIYYRHFYGNQLEKILRVQRRDTVFDITLAGIYSNGMDGSTLSTEFRSDNLFKKSWADIQTVKDDPHFMAYYIDSVWTFYRYNSRFDLTENAKVSSRFYKEIKENPETGERDTLFEKTESLGKIQNTEFLCSISYANYSRNLPETITLYSKNKNTKKRLEIIETAGAYMDKIELFTIGKNHFIYIKMSETSGTVYGHFYAVDLKKMVLNKVEGGYGDFKIPDSLSVWKGYGIVKEADKFVSGAILRSENGSNKEYSLHREFKMTEENNKFVLKCISTKIYSNDY